MHHRWSMAFRPLVVFVIGSVVFLSTAGAEEATPRASPAASGSVACPLNERLTVEKLRELGAMPAPGEPEGHAVYFGGATPPPGEPADAATVDAVTGVIRQYFACVDAGDWPAAYALLADDTIRYLVTDEARALGVDPADFALLDKTPVPHRGRLRYGHIAVGDVTVRPDGRIGAVIEFEGGRKRERAGIRYLSLVYENDSWRIVSPTVGAWFGERHPDAATPTP